MESMSFQSYENQIITRLIHFRANVTNQKSKRVVPGDY